MVLYMELYCFNSENCVDRHAEEDPDRVAIIWERDEPGDTQFITYRSVH